MALVRVDPTATDFCLEDNTSCLGSALQLGTVEVDKGRPYTIPALTEIRVKLEDLGTGHMEAEARPCKIRSWPENPLSRR